jgi:hypothetical protein
MKLPGGKLKIIIGENCITIHTTIEGICPSFVSLYFFVLGLYYYFVAVRRLYISGKELFSLNSTVHLQYCKWLTCLNLFSCPAD